jgi:hypothetical protein
MSAGRRWAKVPTSRAVPQAEGWPVSENGPVARLGDLAGEQMDVVDQVVAQTPRVCWLKPMVQ